MSKNVPEIRFEGFSDEWKLAKLGSLYRVYSGGTPSRKREENYKNPITPWIKTTDLNNNVINKNEESISEEATKKMRLLPKETVLIAMYGGYNQIGRTGMLSFPATINQALSALEPINDIYSYFLITELNKRVNEWKKIAASSRKDPNITKKDVENFFIYYSSISEQTKIGNFFKQLDERITIANQELTRLKETKQGFLQKMFPKEGEVVPEIRFDGFNKEWKSKKLEEIATFNPKTKRPQEFEYVDLESVIGTSLISYKKETKDSAPSRAQRVAKKGDVFYQTVRPYQKNNYLFNLEYDNFVFSTGYAQLRPVGDSYFLLSALQEDTFVSRVLNNCTGTSYPAINSKDLSQIGVVTPIVLKEQTAIGNFFKKLDDTITLQQQELDLLKETKKGFLQKMFI